MSSQNPSVDTTATSAVPVQTITYICGECRAESQIKPRENIRCHDCGHRVLYKKRSEILSVFEGSYRYADRVPNTTLPRFGDVLEPVLYIPSIMTNL
ncbi:unnamed protein product [Rodentolepis nana]|uniref:DNA-directed RNA polymerases I, II, and III subunit RPABC4 n=1 Tax=Rodentolepis nana TaxID=102285 RepID=A0A158QGS0_RODNA|nr:unnamed protein product [Rodentolepis nana]